VRWPEHSARMEEMRKLQESYRRGQEDNIKYLSKTCSCRVAFIKGRY